MCRTRLRLRPVLSLQQCRSRGCEWCNPPWVCPIGKTKYYEPGPILQLPVHATPRVQSFCLPDPPLVLFKESCSVACPLPDLSLTVWPFSAQTRPSRCLPVTWPHPHCMVILCPDQTLPRCPKNPLPTPLSFFFALPACQVLSTYMSSYFLPSPSTPPSTDLLPCTTTPHCLYCHCHAGRECE